jgi:nitrogen fixation/metabolism regulation signal transduction histidine kinase
MAYLFVKNHLDFSIYMGLILVLQVVFLVKFLNRTNRKIAYFFNAVENEDSTIHFPENNGDNSIKELNKSLNRVNNLIQKVKIENQAQEQYYHTILEQATVGILTINEKGHIILANKTVKTLLDYENLTHIQQLKKINLKLFNLISSLKPFDQKLIQFPNEREMVQLTVKATPIKMDTEELLLVSIQNINNELNDKEVDSWGRLFRVLTHEIMNSIAPITSLSETLSDFYKKEEGLISPEEIKEIDIVNTVKGLDIIQNQGKDLISFVNAYRSLTKIPNPDRVILSVQTLFEKIRILVSQEEGFHNIKFVLNVTPKTLEVYADEKQIIQVLFNLTKNALESLATSSGEGVVELKGEINLLKKVVLSVSDTGNGIAPELLDQVFIPFFTTREKGTGIGLSLSKHIMRIHNGSLQVTSIPSKKTTFTLSF